MDEAFMSLVAERIAAATEAVSSFSPTADPGKLPAVQTMGEWMTSHSPGATVRCGDCKAPLVEGSTTICISCGRQLPPRLAVKRDPFSFDKSLAKILFYESVHLEDPHDTSTDTTDELQLQPTSSGISANGYSEQRPPSATGFGVEEVERSVLGAERGKAIVSDASDSIISAAPRNKPLRVEEEEEEYIWGSADADGLGSRAWTQRLARDSGADPKDFSSANNSASLYSANGTLGQASSINDDPFFVAASISADLSLYESGETDFNFFFPSASNPVGQSRGEQENTAGPSTSKEPFGPGVGTDFPGFSQASHHTSGDQSLGPKVETSDPFVREGSTGQTVGENFDDFFQTYQKATDQSHRHSEETGISFSAEESSNPKIETDLDDFFQGVSKSADHPRGLNIETPALQKAEESSSHKIETHLGGFFNTVSESAGHSSGLNVETPIPHAAEGSNGQDGELESDFDDFLQAAPRSTDQFGGSNVNSQIPRVVEDVSGQRGEEPYFDFFFQTPQSAYQTRGQKVEADAPQFPERTSGRNVETEFDFFFHAGPLASVNQSRCRNVETDAANLVKESSDQKVDNHFDDFFQVSVKSADQDHAQNAETRSPISAEEKISDRLRADYRFFQTVPESANHPGGLKVVTPAPQPAEGYSGQDGESDFDDFFQAAPVPASPSGGQNMNGTEPKSTKGSGGQNIETDFDDFFRAAPKPAKGSGGRNALTDFDFFFQTPSKSEDKLHVKHAQPGVPDSVEKSNGQTTEPDFDEFFHAASNTVNRSHGQKVKTVAGSPAKAHVGLIQETHFEDFFQAAPKAVGKSNGHDAAGNFDFFQLAPQGQTAPLKGQNVSMGFDGVFPTAPHTVDRSFGKSETRGFDPFLQAAPLSLDKSLDQNGVTDLDSGDFDDFVQAAPQSADEVVGQSQSTEFDSFFHARSRLVDDSQQRLTTDCDDFFQAAPRTADKSPTVNTSTQFDFLNSSFQSAEKSHHKAKSIDFGNIFQVAPPKNEAPNPTSNSSGLFVYGNGSGQTTQAGASPISTLTQGRSSNGDVLRQLEGLHLSPGAMQPYPEPPKQMSSDLSDLSSRLADQLVVSDEAATNMWSFN